MVGSLLRGFYSISGARVARLLLQLLITPIVVRLLGPAYGDYAFVISVWAMVMVVSNGGVFSATRKFISERRGASWESDVFAFYARVTAVFVALVAVIGALVMSIGTAGRFDEQYVVYTFLIVLMVGASSVLSLFRSALMGFRQETVSESLFTVQMLLMGVVGVSLAYLGWAVVGLLVGHLVATLAVIVVMFVFITDHVSVKRVLQAPTDGFPARRLLSFSLSSVAFLLLMESLYHADILFVRLLVGREATAHYKAALLAAEFLWIIPIAIQQVLLHSTSELWAASKYDSIQDLSAKVTRYSVLLTTLFAVGIAVLAEEFIGLYFGPGFAPAVLPLLVLLPGAFGFAVARGIFSIGHAKGEMRILILATGGAAVLNLVLNVLLIPQYGTLGAAVATTVGYGSMLVFHVRAARLIGFDPLADLRPGPTAITGLTTAAVLFILNSVIGSGLLTLVVVPPVGLGVFLLLAIKTGAIDTEEIRYVTGGILRMTAR